MPVQFSFTLTEVPGDEETVLLCSCKTPNPGPDSFKRATIVYADLTPQEKTVYDNFKALVESKCNP